MKKGMNWKIETIVDTILPMHVYMWNWCNKGDEAKYWKINTMGFEYWWCNKLAYII